MKKEKIEELFENNQTEYTMEGEWFSEMTLSDFVQAINQAEKEILIESYQNILAKLEFIYESDIKIVGGITNKRVNLYYQEIKEKIKELENEN